MIPPHKIILGLTALFALGCQQPVTKEKGTAAMTNYHQRTAQSHLEPLSISGKDTLIKIDKSIFDAALNDEIITIPDAVFLNTLIKQGIDLDGDSQISKAEALTIVYLRIVNKEGLYSMEGLQEFKNLRELIFTNISDLEILPLDLPSLNLFSLSGSKVSSLNLSRLPNLTFFGLSYNDFIKNLDLSPVRHTLEKMTIYDVPAITSLDFRAYTHLNAVFIYNMKNLRMLEMPLRHDMEAPAENVKFEVKTNPVIETLDIHRMPKNMSKAVIEGNTILKKVYVNADQYAKFKDEYSGWVIQHPDLLEIVQ